jgi:hypothetical protein
VLSGLRRSWNGARRASIALVVLTWLVMPTRSQAGDVRGASQAAKRLRSSASTTTATNRPSYRLRTAHPTTRVAFHALGRGNQLRVTVVLADDVLREYAEDCCAATAPTVR